MLDKFISRTYVPECDKGLLDYMKPQNDALLSGMLTFCRVQTVIREKKTRSLKQKSVTDYF
jgi:hypothetical protein